MSRNKQRSKRQAKAPDNSNHSSHAESSRSASSSKNLRPASTESALLFVYTETPLHVGCGEGLGSIDLPIQRERITGLPIAPGSGIKGALREVFRGHGDNDDEFALFGPAPPTKGANQAPTHAGALSLTDARLLLLPIRTIYGGWAWATCPMILERLARDLEIAGHARPRWADLEALKSLNDPQVQNKNPQALTFDDAPSIAPDRNNLLLEDTLYSVQRAAPKDIAEELVRVLQEALPRQESYKPLKRRLAQQLVVLSDAELKHWAKHGTEVITRVRIDDESGTVVNGALWNEEALPSESLLWSLALVSPSRKPGEDRKAKELLGSLKEHLHTRIFLGGDRTIGRGLCGLNLRLRETT